MFLDDGMTRVMIMAETNGLVCAFVHLSDGLWKRVGWNEVRMWKSEQGLLWVHLDRTVEQARKYLQDESGLDRLVSENLVAEETRPRALEIDGNSVVNLRGVNLNPGAEPEDMVSIRMSITPERIITTRHRRLMAIDDLRERMVKGRGPRSAGDFLVDIAGLLVDRMAPIIEDLDEVCDELEDRVVTGEHANTRSKLAAVRRQAISLRRYLAPQREAMSRIHAETIGWLDARHKAQLREITDRVTRYVEDLDAIRERAAVIQDEVINRVSEQMNRNTYLLALVATIVLPLGLITGLLGINVDGIPGSADTPWAFNAVVGVLVLLVIAEYFVLRKLKWF